MSRSHEPSFMGKRGDHKRVAIWTERQLMDILLTEFAFPVPTGYRIITASIAAGPGFGIRCNKEVFAI